LTYNTEWNEPLPQSYLETEVHPHSDVREIYFVDISISPAKFEQIFSYLRSINRLRAGAIPVVCIDHHITALENRAELESYCTEVYIRIGEGLSGATLVWEYFDREFGTQSPMPVLLSYVADQDVWDWKLPMSEEINGALNVLNGTVDEMRRELVESIEDSAAWIEAKVAAGVAILKMVDAQVWRTIRNVREYRMNEATLLVVNSTAFNSETGNHLCIHHERTPDVVALLFSLQNDFSVRCSFRSIAGGKVTARTLAERFGGGGHDHAAGCRFATFDEFRCAIADLASVDATRAAG